MKGFYVPERFKGRTGYQIMPDLFYQSPNTVLPEISGRIIMHDGDEPIWRPEADGEYRNRYFYGGNLQGIKEKLDFIHSMGFDLIYCNPINFTYDNHHYGILDHDGNIDPFLGKKEDLVELINEAHKRDMLFVQDVVFNHMSVTSKYYQKALAGDEKYKKWFDYDKHGNVTNWDDITEYKQCNKKDPSYIDYVCSEAEEYAKKGVDAFRIDLGEKFPIEFMQEFFIRIKRINPEICIINERWDYANDEYGNYIDLADTIMNYRSTDGIGLWLRNGNYEHFNYVYGRLKQYPKEVQDSMWNLMDSHDTIRATTLYSGKGINENPFQRMSKIEDPWNEDGWFNTYGFRKWEYENCFDLNLKEAKKRLKLGAVIFYSVRGIPMVFSGTELGVLGYKDPHNRIKYPWHIIDMIEKGMEHETYPFFCELGNKRQESKEILTSGEMEYEGTENILKITRKSNDGIWQAIVNRTKEYQRINAEFSDNDIIINSGNSSTKVLEPLGYTITRV